MCGVHVRCACVVCMCGVPVWYVCLCIAYYCKATVSFIVSHPFHDRRLPSIYMRGMVHGVLSFSCHVSSCNIRMRSVHHLSLSPHPMHPTTWNTTYASKHSALMLTSHNTLNVSRMCHASKVVKHHPRYRHAEMCFRSMAYPHRAAQNEPRWRPSAPSVKPTRSISHTCTPPPTHWLGWTLPLLPVSVYSYPL